MVKGYIVQLHFLVTEYIQVHSILAYLHCTLITLVETNLHASCPESGVVVVGSMVSYLVESSMVIFVGGGGGLTSHKILQQSRNFYHKN